MRIGIVSDTHNHLANVARIVELFDEAGVERVVHTGDITQARTLEVFGRLRAPLVGVYGNNDERAALASTGRRLGMDLHDGPLELDWAGRRILVVHDPRDLDAALAPHHAVALHGHVHRLVIERRLGALVLNPGECAGHLPGHNAVAVLDLRTLEPEILRF
jgi:putative phosphoesterase